jgi:hypothetical protein
MVFNFFENLAVSTRHLWVNESEVAKGKFLFGVAETLAFGCSYTLHLDLEALLRSSESKLLELTRFQLFLRSLSPSNCDG